jgi:membrane fusion protein, multidrug efflux system
MKRRNGKAWAAILLLAGAASIGAGCKEKKAVLNEEEKIPVRAQKVQLRDIAEAVEYVGDIRGVDEAKVYPKVSGKVMEKVKEEGAKVAKGDTLMYLDRDEVGMQYAKAPVESPLSGIVGRLYVDIGSNVSAQSAVALVMDMSKAKILLEVPEIHLPRVAVGQKASIRVDAYPGEVFEGTVTQVSPVVSLENRAAPVEILLDNADGRLRSGMFAHVALILQIHTGVPVVPKEAVLGKNSERFVYVVRSGKAKMAPVRIGVREGPQYEIKSGLAAGDMVVVVGQQRLREGVSVLVEQE